MDHYLVRKQEESELQDTSKTRSTENQFLLFNFHIRKYSMFTLSGSSDFVESFRKSSR